MSKIIMISLIGYVIGSISPAALLSKIKHKDLRKIGTGNLGATNTMLVFGKNYGAFVMLFDIFKAVFAAGIAEVLFKNVSFAPLLSSCFSVVGHIFPFYLKFRGGKGLATFGGMILSFDPITFVILLAFTLALMFTFNYGVAMPISAAVLFPILAFLKTKSIAVLAISFAVSLLVICKHIPNLKKAMKKEEITVRDYLKRLAKH